MIVSRALGPRGIQQTFRLTTCASAIAPTSNVPFPASLLSSPSHFFSGYFSSSAFSTSPQQQQQHMSTTTATVSSSSPSSTPTIAHVRRGPRDVPDATEARLENFFYDPELSLNRRQKQVFSRVADEPPTPSVQEHGLLYGITEEELAGRNPMLRRALSTRTAAAAELRSFRMTQIVNKYATAPLDTGSSRVQLATLTERINRLTAHLAKNKHDTHCKRQLLVLSSRRRRLLQYMLRKDYHSYRLMVSELALRPVPVIGSKHVPKVRVESHKQILERNKRLKNRTSRGDRGH